MFIYPLNGESMKTLTQLGWSFALSLTMAAPVFAADTAGQDKETARKIQDNNQAQEQQETMPVRRASKTIGATVNNPKGEKLGRVEDLALDPEQGRIAYAVLSISGVTGMADKLIAIPWKALTMGNDSNHYTLDVDEKALRAAPNFDKNHWPDMANENWRQEIHDYYQQKPYWQEKADMAEKSAGTVINDTLITAKAKAALLADPAVKGSAISVETSQGEVRLSGAVASPDEAKRAVETVRALAGVKSVRNDISVKP